MAPNAPTKGVPKQTAGVKASAKGKGKKSKCLTDGCSSEATRRGLCASCRIAAKALIDKGETTEEELVRNGLLLRKYERCGKLRTALQSRRQNNDSGSEGEERQAAEPEGGKGGK